MVPASLLMVALLVFTGFIVPIRYMLSWCRWINYVNPVAYAFEALMVNEFHGRQFNCSMYVPLYGTPGAPNVACNAIGAEPGLTYVDGGAYIAESYNYYHSHKWRNVGIILAMMLFNYCAYFLASEYVSAKKSKGEVLVFRRRFVPKATASATSSSEAIQDEEKSGLGGTAPAQAVLLEKPGNRYADDTKGGGGGVQGSKGVFHWSNVCYDIQIKGKTRRILNNIDGWVKPGTLTALMGVSGAGKTTLLDCLADRRAGVGVLTGEMLVDGKMRHKSFQSQTGYVQQLDLHLSTSTVREVSYLTLLRYYMYSGSSRY